MSTVAQNIVPSPETSPISVVRQLSTLDQNAIVRPQNPPPGIAGFLFDINLEDAISLRTDITDHYVESNTAIQDQAALQPERVTVRGLVAELVKRAPVNQTISKTTNPLPVVPELLPVFTPGTEQTLVAVAAKEAAASRAAVASQDLYNFYRNRAPTQPNQTRQSAAFLYFYALRNARQVFTVETPWGFWTSMLIESLDVSQPAETRYMSDFSITFKKITFAKDITVNVGQLAGRNAPQASASQPTQNGNAGLSDQTQSEWDRYRALWSTPTQ